MTSSTLGICLLKLSIDLYTQLQPLHKQDNIVYSPYSVGSALSMALAGARGNTAKQLLAVLHVTESDKINEKFGQLLNELPHEWNSDVTFRLANMMYSERALKVRKEFEAVLQRDFRARIKSVDFKKNHESVRKEANQWVSAETQSRITELIPPGEVSENTVSIILNAIYFKSAWENQFDQTDTKNQTFHLNSRSSVQVEMMSMSDATFKVGQSKDLKATLVEMPYIGETFSMVILVPDEVEGLSFLEGQLSEARLRSALNSLAMKGNVELTLPKFKVEYSASLKEALSALGAEDLFSNSADLSGIFQDDRVCISEIFHKTFVQVNEEGTEAAASTAGVVDWKSANIYTEPVTRVVVDHPFMFLIRKNEGNVMLFLGSVRKL